MTQPAESTLDELRTALGAYAGMARRRWRPALLALALVGSGAFWASRYLPRQYRATTVFERSDDAVLRSLVQGNSPYAFGHVRSSLSLDMTGSRALADAAVAVGLLEADAVRPEGALSAEELHRIDRALAGFNLRATVGLLQSTASLDVIELRCDANDPQVAQRFATALRDRYIRLTRAMTGSVLRSTQEFFEAEFERHRQAAQRISEQIQEAAADFPGVDATDPTSAGSRLEAARAELARLRQQQDELHAQILARERFLARPPAPADADGAPAEAAAAPRPIPPLIRARMEAIERQIAELTTVRRMTTEHPAVQALFRQLDDVHEELRAAPSPGASEALAGTPDAAGPGPLAAERARVELELGALRGQSTVVATRIEEAAQRTARLESLYERVVDENGTLRRQRERLEQEMAAAATWGGHLAQLAQVMAAESEQRGTIFRVVEEAKLPAQPLKPRATSVAVMCLGVGVAAAVVLMALSELRDRSFRTVGQVTRSLGLPVLECVEVIPTPPERRRRVLAQLIWTPTIAAGLLLLLATGSRALVSVAGPAPHGSPGVAEGLGGAAGETPTEAGATAGGDAGH